jgi:hypothetical protein
MSKSTCALHFLYTFNINDKIDDQGGSEMLLIITQTASGYSALFEIGISLYTK